MRPSTASGHTPAIDAAHTAEMVARGGGSPRADAPLTADGYGGRMRWDHRPRTERSATLRFRCRQHPRAQALVGWEGAKAR
jgi:hypothetical protein